MKYLRLLLIITFFAAIFFNSMSPLTILGHCATLVMMLLITQKYKFGEHLSKYIVLLTYWASLMFMPAFHLVKSLQGADGMFGYKITPLDYERILDFGAIVIPLTCIAWFVFSIFHTKRSMKNISYEPTHISNGTVRILFAFMYGISLLSLFIGLSRMGSEGVALPFHLSGIITLLRIVVFPIIFAAIVENYILRKKKIPIDFFVLFFVWTLLETIVRLSKSAIISSFMITAIIMYIYYRPKIGIIVRVATPIIAIFLFLYPVVEIMRSGDTANVRTNFMTAFQQVSEEDNGNTLLQPLNRTFMIPSHYAKDYSYVDQNQLFDFSKAPTIIAWGGSARYQTFVIDGYPLGIAHSSGTTALEDPLLIGGYGLCFIVIILLVLFAEWLDSMQYKKMYTIYISLVLLLWSYSNTQNISALLDSVGLQYLIARLFTIWVIYKMNFRRKQPVLSPRYLK